MRYSVVLTAGVHKQVDGSKVVKLPPMIIFKNLQQAPKGKFPVRMVVEGTKGGTITKDLMMNSYIPLLRKRPGSFFNQPETLLVMDTATYHSTEEVKQGFSNLKTNVKFIEGVMTPLLQVMDTRVKNTFKDGMKSKWVKCIEEGEVGNTKSSKR